MSRKTILLLLSSALCALPFSAEACQVDPDKATLSALSRSSSAIVLAAVVRVDGVLKLRVDELISGDRSILGGRIPGPLHGTIVEGQSGIAFVGIGPKGPRLMGAEHGWVPEDSGAITFVRSFLKTQGRSAELSTLITALGSSSARVRQNALRALSADFPEELAQVTNDQANTIEVAARSDWDKPLPARAAFRALGLLPRDLGVPALILASKMGIEPGSVASALAKHPRALTTLGAELRLRRGQLTQTEVFNRIEVLGRSGSTAVVADLLSVVGDPACKSRVIQGLSRFGDVRALDLFQTELKSGSENDAAWSVFGLAAIGGQRAIGALHFARNNNASPRIRSLINQVLKNPIKSRRDFERRGWKSIPAALPRRQLAPIGKATVQGKRLVFTPPKKAAPERALPKEN